MPSKAVEHWIIIGNIERFEKLLVSETNPIKRKTLQGLLIKEKAKLGLRDD